MPAKIRQQLGRRAIGRARLGDAASRGPLGGRRAAARRRRRRRPPPPRLREKMIVQRTGQLMYELSTHLPGHFRHSPGLRVGCAVRAHRRRPAVHRPAPQFSAAPLRVRRLEPQRDRRIPGEPDPAPPPPRTSSSRPTRHSASRGIGSADADGHRSAGVRAASRRYRDRPRRHVARHAALGLRVGLCDLTAGEMGSNGTPEERLPRPRRPATVLGAAWRENLGWPDRRIGKDPAHLEQAVAFIRRHQPRTVAVPYWSDRHPDHAAASDAAHRGGVQRRPAALSGRRARRGSRIGSATTSSTIRAAVLRRRRVRALRAEARRRSTATRASSSARTPAPRHAAEHAAVPAARREPRRAVRRAGRRAWAEGFVVASRS